MTQEWRIRRKQGACALCGRGFEEGERLRSLLCIEEAEIARRDLCAECCAAAPDEATLSERVRAALAAEAPAAAQAAGGDETAPAPTDTEGSPAPFALYWWSTRQRGTPARKVQLDMDLIERLFLDLEGRAEEPLRELRYLLCLLLMRKRRLKLDAVRRGEGGEALLVHRPRRSERLVVHVHDFGAERMDELRARLEALLEGVEPGADPDGADSGRADSDGADSADGPGGDPPADAPDPTPADGAAPSAGARR